MPAKKSVLLLHDQLHDARMWVELRPLVQAYATVVTIAPPPLHTIGPPAAWADHVSQVASELVSSDPVDVAVTVGGAVGAGIRLVDSGLARAGLLLDPDLTPLATQSTRQVLDEPDAVDRLTVFFEGVDAHLEEFVGSGTLSDEGVDALVDATLADTEELPSSSRELLRQMMKEQLLATLPLDVERQQTATADRSDWITQLAPVADRCVVAASLGTGMNGRLELATELPRRVPDVRVVDLTPSASYILSHPPDEVAALVRSLVERA